MEIYGDLETALKDARQAAEYGDSDCLILESRQYGVWLPCGGWRGP